MSIDEPKHITKSSQLPRLKLSPSTAAQVQRLADDSGTVAKIAALTGLLEHHSDPVVRVAIGEIKEAVAEWAEARSAASKVEGGECDHYDLVLPAEGDPITIGNRWSDQIEITVDPQVEPKHVIVEFSDGRWVAHSESNRNPNRRNTWSLNGEEVGPHDFKPIEPGDVIRVGSSLVHLRAPE